ncbi:MAG: alpha/beta hydrolase [Chloroflexi bacterium]|nr:alpha/beta hydrolase [Chloroflexota bacterium]
MNPAIANAGARLLRLAARVRGKPLDFEPVVRLLGMRPFARRFYGALIDANGASFADVDETIGRIHSLKPEVWTTEWRVTAQRFDRAGRDAAALGRGVSAVELLTRASTYYRFAEMTILADTSEREELQAAAVGAYLLAGRFMDPPLQRVCLPVNGIEVPAYLRVPRSPAAPPVALIVPGLGMVKEHGDFPDTVLLQRGVATLTVDLPGQGESRALLPMTRDNGVGVVQAGIDFLMRREDVDHERLGLVGTSLGAGAAMLAAAGDRRVKAMVEIAGFYYPTAWWHLFPENIKEFLRYVIGAADQAELLGIVAPINLRGVVERIDCPLLIVHGGCDQIVLFGESDLIYAEAGPAKERLTFPLGDHACVNIGEARPMIGDWLAEKLGVRAENHARPSVEQL